LKLYEYAIRRIILMFGVLVALSAVMFYLARGVLPPTTALAPFITPRMNDIAKLSLARSLGVATASCPSYSAFSSQVSGCVVPLWGQYVGWLQQIASGNWGYTLLPGIAGTQTTWTVFWARFPFTAELAIAASVLTMIIGFPLGIVSATHNNRPPDHASRIIALGGYSIPQFWFAAILQIIFVLYISINGSGILPGSGALSTTCGLCVANPGGIGTFTGMPVFDALLSGNPGYFWDSLLALVLPALTLAITSIGALTRIIRSSMLEALRQDYILLARSKGLRERVVVYRHALRNAVLPAITISGLLVAFYLGGAVIIEDVFSWPGVGATSVAAISVVDVNFIELYTLVTALIIVIANLFVDIIYAKIDPRIRY
jgi:peptide/nickel transport system permease protein